MPHISQNPDVRAHHTEKIPPSIRTRFKFHLLASIRVRRGLLSGCRPPTWATCDSLVLLQIYGLCLLLLFSMSKKKICFKNCVRVCRTERLRPNKRGLPARWGWCWSPASSWNLFRYGRKLTRSSYLKRNQRETGWKENSSAFFSVSPPSLQL